MQEHDRRSAAGGRGLRSVAPSNRRVRDRVGPIRPAALTCHGGYLVSALHIRGSDVTNQSRRTTAGRSERDQDGGRGTVRAAVAASRHLALGSGQLDLHLPCGGQNCPHPLLLVQHWSVCLGPTICSRSFLCLLPVCCIHLNYALCLPLLASPFFPPS